MKFEMMCSTGGRKAGSMELGQNEIGSEYGGEGG